MAGLGVDGAQTSFCNTSRIARRAFLVCSNRVACFVMSNVLVVVFQVVGNWPIGNVSIDIYSGLCI